VAAEHHVGVRPAIASSIRWMPTSTTFMPGGPDSGTGRRPIAIRAWTKLIGIVPELALRKNSALTGWSQTDWQ
jgi:hypothetical protein